MQTQQALTGISSMATRQVLAEMVTAWGRPVSLESVGGVDAAKRVQAGEPFDVVVLASNAIDQLMAQGHLRPGRVDLVRSGVAVAIPRGAPRPDISTEDALKRAVQAARRISYSTGPSGVHLARLFDRWGLAAQLKDRVIEASPGVPVGTLVARGESDLGFQQLSELMHLDGIEVLGQLPASVQVITTFSAGVGAGSARSEEARAFLAYLASPATEDVKRRHGMEAA
jgi:molybdate transport system substrate-binding protein